MPVDDALFKLAMSHFTSGVTVVTTEHDGTPYGMTVASFASLSLHPPLVLVCIEKNTKSHDAIIGAKQFGVSVLSAEQTQLSNRFASRSDDKFTGVALDQGELGVPLIAGAICQLECRVHEQLPGGDHTIFIGEVMNARTAEGTPLVYWRSSYRQIAQ
ncbi:MAG TPA: flavin reductase family protein [Thermoanaerobaculia bacterium]|jgi:flavin reductase (DIM6/NTAB) family NADH-FMN oxidoreductase RutF